MTLSMSERVYRAAYRHLETGASPALLDWWGRAERDGRGCIEYFDVFVPDDLVAQVRLIVPGSTWQRIVDFTGWLRPWVRTALAP